MSPRQKIEFFSPSLREVQRRGRRDGRRWKWQAVWPFVAKTPVPPVDAKESTTYVHTLRQSFEHDILHIAKEWVALDVTLKSRYCKCLREERAAQEPSAKEPAEADVAAGKRKSTEDERNELDHPTLDRKWMIFWLAAIGIAELPINAKIFQLLGTSPTETIIVAMGLGIMIPVLADRCGESLKQRVKTSTDRLLIALAPLVIMGLLVAISYLRASYFKAAAELLRAKLQIDISPTQAAIFFILINMAFFFAALLVSYAGSYPDASKHDRLKKKLGTARKRESKEMAEAKQAVDRRDAAGSALEIAKAERQKRFEEYKHRALELQELCDYYMSEYITTNLRSRTDGVVPTLFETKPAQAEIPAVFKSDLDWDCSLTPAAHSNDVAPREV